jgi:WD40 repeat protein
LDIQVVELSLPPKLSASFIHDDWISSVQINPNGNQILTGSYDSFVRIWNEQGQVVKAISGGRHAVKAVTWLSDDMIIYGDAKNNIFAYKVNEN